MDDEDSTIPTPLHETLQIAAVKDEPCLTILAGDGAGRVHRLAGNALVVGRAEECDIRINTVGVSRRHAELRCSKEGAVAILDLESTNGVWVEGSRVQNHMLRDGERIQLGANAVLQFGLSAEDPEELQRRLYEYATRDPLTGAFNRRVFDEHLARDLSHALRHDRQVSLLVLEIDELKAISEEHGTRARDHVLARVGQLLMRSMRREELLCRIDDPQLAILIRDANPDAAVRFAERIRKLIESEQMVFDEAPLTVTLSVGVAGFAAEYPTPEALLGAGVEALYDAKRAGGNSVCAAD